MKRFLRILIAAAALCILFVTVPFQNSCEELYEDVFRVHIIPNSDSAADQSLKLTVRDAVLSDISPLFRSVRTKEDAMRITEENRDRIEQTAQRALCAAGSAQTVTAKIRNLYFNTRVYDGFVMPAGYYDALELTIGEGKGQNFWCVMYPTLCVGAATKDKLKEDLDDDEYKVVTSDDLEFRFIIVEYFEKIRSCFR